MFKLHGGGARVRLIKQKRSSSQKTFLRNFPRPNRAATMNRAFIIAKIENISLHKEHQSGDILHGTRSGQQGK